MSVCAVVDFPPLPRSEPPPLPPSRPPVPPRGASHLSGLSNSTAVHHHYQQQQIAASSHHQIQLQMQMQLQQQQQQQQQLQYHYQYQQQYHRQPPNNPSHQQMHVNEDWRESSSYYSNSTLAYGLSCILSLPSPL